QLGAQAWAWPGPRLGRGGRRGPRGKSGAETRTTVVNLIFGLRVLHTRPGESGAPGLMKGSRRVTDPAGMRVRRERGAGPSERLLPDRRSGGDEARRERGAGPHERLPAGHRPGGGEGPAGAGGPGPLTNPPGKSP